MGHFALVDENGIVQQILKAEQENIDSGIHGDPSQWIQTSYNTQGGIHYNPETGEPDGGIALRYNYAAIGGHYDAEADAFYHPQPYPNWVLNTSTYIWEPPVPQPSVPPGAPNYWVWAVARNEWVYDEPTTPTE
jgi:hypothetical protein